MRFLLKNSILLLFLGFFLSGCSIKASKDASFAMQLPFLEKVSYKIDPNKTLYVDEITDNRSFEIRSDGSSQSGGNNTANSMDFSVPAYNPDLHEKSKIVGAKRRVSDPKIFGAILLKDEQTVEYMVKASIISAAKANGYKILKNKADIKNNTVIVKSSINKFWTWETGANAGVANIYTGIVEAQFTFTRNNKQLSDFTATGKKSRHGWPKERNFFVVINEAYKIFTDDFADKFSNNIK